MLQARSWPHFWGVVFFWGGGGVAKYMFYYAYRKLIAAKFVFVRVFGGDGAGKAQIWGWSPLPVLLRTCDVKYVTMCLA